MSEIVALGPQGQFTLPTTLRRSLKLNRGGRLVVDRIGEYIVMRRAGSQYAKLNQILSQKAEEDNFTPAELDKLLTEIKREIWADEG